MKQIQEKKQTPKRPLPIINTDSPSGKTKHKN